MNNYKAFFALYKQGQEQGFTFTREEIIEEHTNGAKSSLKELLPEEYDALIKHLSNAFQTSVKKDLKKDWQNSPENRMRKKIIVQLKKCGYTDKRGKADMKAIYHWVEKHGYLHKHLNKYTYNELPKLVYQAEQYYLKSL